MSWLKNLDLERAIILCSVLLMPVAGGWVYLLDKEIKDGKAARVLATNDKSGVIVRIATLQKQIGQHKKSATEGDDNRDARTYFERMIMDSQRQDNSPGSIGRSDFVIQPKDAKPVRKKPNRKFLDTEVDIKFRRGGTKAYAVGRSFINAFIFNAEANGGRIWKLRALKMTNQDIKPLRGKKEMPPAEVADLWLIDKIAFARREVDKTTRKKRN